MYQERKLGQWHIAYDAEDGGRISRLSYSGTDLLTTPSHEKQMPQGDFGKFETRPVYGYDDCFPSVDPSVYPGLAWEIPDHGELCWLSWDVESLPEGLRFHVDSEALPLHFTRIMEFEPDRLIWKFEVENNSNAILPFQHVMHALLPLEDIVHVTLPEFEMAADDIQHKIMGMKSGRDVTDFLLSTPRGVHHMLFLQRLKAGKLKWEYAGGISVEMIFDKKLFPSLGIWWNNHSYPGEDRCRRTECAFEPTPGNNSNLAQAYNEGLCMFVEPARTLKWKITWKINKT